MRNVSRSDPLAPSGFLGLLRSWLSSWSEQRHSAETERGSEPGAYQVVTHQQVRVLIVDDNPVNLMVISTLLEAKGIAPSQAMDGAQAVALVSNCQFDLILMDLQMPVLDGLEATTAIRRFEHKGFRPAVPVIAYTSMSLGTGILAFHGMNGKLAKPCDEQTLEDCLMRWCPGYKGMTESAKAEPSLMEWQDAQGAIRSQPKLRAIRR